MVVVTAFGVIVAVRGMCDGRGCGNDVRRRTMEGHSQGKRQEQQGGTKDMKTTHNPFVGLSTWEGQAVCSTLIVIWDSVLKQASRCRQNALSRPAEVAMDRIDPRWPGPSCQ